LATKKNQKPPKSPSSWIWVASILLSIVFCLSGAVNAGITGPYFATPWAIFLVVAAALKKWYARPVLLVIAPVCVLLYYAHDFAPAMFYHGIGQAVAIAKDTTPDESNMLSCGEMTGSRGPNESSGIRIAAGRYKIVGVTVIGGIDAPIEWKYVIAVPGTGRNLANAATFVVDTDTSHSWNYSCVSSGPKSKKIVRRWVDVAGFPIYFSIWISMILAIIGILRVI
jgi:hypothetical protein